MNTGIVEEELPVSAGLRVVRINDPDYGLSEDEIQDRNEFIHCYLMKDYRRLMTIPEHEPETDFFFPDCCVDDSEYSAFNTVDFQRRLRPFDKYGYAMKMIMERIKDLAIQHSVIDSPEGRNKLYRRYQTIVELEFRNRLLRLVEQYKYTWDDERRLAIKQRVAEINRRILECKSMWEQFAPGDN